MSAPLPTRELRAVTVYCSSSRHVEPAFFEAARELGTAIAGNGWRLVYGGNRVGCMGALADAARAAGGRVTGITPQSLVDLGIADEHCDELVVTSGMRERKALLEERGDAFVALPGGLGTFEELFEILVGRVLGYHGKPIVIINAADYYRPLLAMIEHGIDRRFIQPKVRDLYHLARNVPEAMRFLRGDHRSPPPQPVASPAQSSGIE